jgi:hypothetical protein
MLIIRPNVMSRTSNEMVRLQDVAKSIIGIGMIYWFFWWCFPLWSGWLPASYSHGKAWAWSMYGIALLGPVMFQSITILYIEWRSRKWTKSLDGGVDGQVSCDTIGVADDNFT